MTQKPYKFKTQETGEFYYICPVCDEEVQENGECFESREPCYYCPPDVCEGCGAGQCDESC